MNNLTTEQLTELTRLINDRLGEFNIDGCAPFFEPVTAGQVRLMYSVIAEWQGDSQASPLPAATPVTKSEFVGIRLEDSQYDALQDIAAGIGKPGNISAAVRHVIDVVPAPEECSISPQAAATLGPEHTINTPLKPASRAREKAEQGRATVGALLPTREEFLAEVKRQSMGGVIPTMKFFDDAKPATWSTAAAHMLRLGIRGWADVAELCGLKMNRLSREPQAVNGNGAHE